jgi:hypothetical protein
MSTPISGGFLGVKSPTIFPLAPERPVLCGGYALALNPKINVMATAYGNFLDSMA